METGTFCAKTDNQGPPKMNSDTVLNELTNMTPMRTADLPRNERGIYGLIDHMGELSYIGSTSSYSQSLYDRVHLRHRTGSEGHSHHFSKVYNCGRMWRNQLTQRGAPDAILAKALRSAFIAEYCRAVYFVLQGTKDEIERLEAAVIAIAPRKFVRWNGATSLVYAEPVELVDKILGRLGYNTGQLAAVNRQNRRSHGEILP
jgi:DNA polymerase III subunit epsilon